MSQIDRLRDRIADLALEETVGWLRPPDVRSRVLGAGAARRLRAARRVDAATGIPPANARESGSGQSSSMWAAALVAVGASLVVAITARQTWCEPPAHAQEVVRDVVTPESFEQWLELLQQVEAVRLTTRAASSIHPVGLTLDKRSADQVRGALSRRGDKVASMCRGAPERELELRLTGRRVAYARLRGLQAGGTPNNMMLDIDGLAGRQVEGKLGETLAPWFQRLERIVQSSATSVRDGKQLATLAAGKHAPQIETMVARSLDGDDLELLSEFPGLKSIDVSSSPRIRGDELAKSPTRDKLVTITMLARQLGKRADWLGDFRRLEVLRVAAAQWAGPDRLISRKCMICHQPSGFRADEPSGDLSGLAKTRRMRKLALLGVVLDKGFGKLIEGLPLLETLHLTACDLRVLDLASLANLPALRNLALVGCTGVDEEDLKKLHKLQNLRRLDLRGFDPSAARAVKLALKKCDVRY